MLQKNSHCLVNFHRKLRKYFPPAQVIHPPITHGNSSQKITIYFSQLFSNYSEQQILKHTSSPTHLHAGKFF